LTTSVALTGAVEAAVSLLVPPLEMHLPTVWLAPIVLDKSA
jgi:hypothetical protein